MTKMLELSVLPEVRRKEIFKDYLERWKGKLDIGGIVDLASVHMLEEQTKAQRELLEGKWVELPSRIDLAMKLDDMFAADFDVRFGDIWNDYADELLRWLQRGD